MSEGQVMLEQPSEGDDSFLMPLTPNRDCQRHKTESKV